MPDVSVLGVRLHDPAYDLLSTIPYIKDGNAALTFSRTRIMAELSRDELTHLAAKARLPESMVIDTALETVERFRQVWDREKNHLPLARTVIDLVSRHASTVKLYRGE